MEASMSAQRDTSGALTEIDYKRIDAMQEAMRAGSGGSAYESYLPGGLEYLERARNWSDTDNIAKSYCEYISIAHERTEYSTMDLAEELGHAWSTIDRHVSGECEHAEGVMHERDCQKAREKRRDGWFTKQVADAHNVSQATVTYHVTGQCQCEPGEPALKAMHKVPVAICERWRRVADRGVSFRAIAEESVWSEGAVGLHVRGECQHE